MYPVLTSSPYSQEISFPSENKKRKKAPKAPKAHCLFPKKSFQSADPLTNSFPQKKSRVISPSDNAESRKTYTLVKVIGEGESASVFQGKDSSDQDVAVKIYNKDEESSRIFSRRWENEISMLRTVSDVQHAVRILDYFRDKKNIAIFDQDMKLNHLQNKYIVMPLLGINLKTHLEQNGTLPLQEVLSIGKQILLFLKGMKDIGLIHGDLKPDNILLKYNKDKMITIIDFESASKVKNDEKPSIIQAQSYRAPEILLGKKDYDLQIDMWSLGALLFELYTGENFVMDLAGGENLQTYNNLLIDISYKLGRLPPSSLIENSENGKELFAKRDDAYEFIKEHSSKPDDDTLEGVITKKAEETGDSDDRLQPFINLLKKMLAYENRISPEKALDELTSYVL